MHGIIAWVALGALALASGGGVRAEGERGFAGTWTDGAITLVVERSGDTFSGQLTWRGRTCPLTCTIEEGVFFGEVVAESVRYSYLLEPDGTDRVRLTVDARTHVLTRVVTGREGRAAVSGGVGPAPDAAPTAAREAASPTDSSHVLYVTRPIDDTHGWVGGQAGSMLVPADWTHELGIQWFLHPTIPARVVFRARSPDGRHEIALHPHRTFVQGPMAVSMHEYYGNTVAAPIGSAAALIRSVVLPQLRAGVVWRDEGVEPMPDLARAVAQLNEHPMARSTADAARLQIAYFDAGGRERVERHFAVYAVQQVGPVTYWQGMFLVTVTSDRAGIDSATAHIPVMLGSIRMDERWFNRMQQISDAFQQLAMANVELARRQSQIIRDVNDAVTASRRAAYEATSRAMDRSMDRFSEYIRGTERWQNHHGEAVTLPSGYEHAWQSDNGSILVSNNPNLDPNTDAATRASNWHAMGR